MTQYTLHATQFIARPVDEVFDFFSGAPPAEAGTAAAR
jgi:hypothetical protein